MKKLKKPIQVKYQTLVAIWAALLISQFLFLAVIYFAKPELFTIDPSQPILGDEPLIIVLFAAMGVVVILLSFVLRNQHMRRAVEDKDAGCVQTGLVLGCALSEFSSLLGVILALAFDYQYFFAWIILGLLGILFHFPRKGNLEAATQTV